MFKISYNKIFNFLSRGGGTIIYIVIEEGPIRIPQVKVTLPCLYFFLFLVVLKDFHSVVIEVREKCLFINAEADFFRLLNLQDFMSCH